MLLLLLLLLPPFCLVLLLPAAARCCCSLEIRPSITPNWMQVMSLAQRDLKMYLAH